jgi:hypothetical protein
MLDDAIYKIPTAPSASELVREGFESHRAGDLEKARNYYLAALQVDPDCPPALSQLALCVADQPGQLETAIHYARRGAVLEPHLFHHKNNLGNLLWRGQQYEESQLVLEKALSMNPDDMGVHHNLGLLYQSMGKFDLAIKHYDRSFQINGQNHRSLSDRAWALLSKGDLLKGLEAHEARWFTVGRSIMWDTDVPRWNGEDVVGKTVLIHHEQGFGDTFLFGRYLEDLHDRGARVIFACPKSLHRLMQDQPYIDRVILDDVPWQSEGSGERVDFHECLMSLPLKLKMGSTPNTKPYFRLDKDFTTTSPKLRVAISWSAGMVRTPTPGNMAHESAVRRSIGLKPLLQLSSIQGVELYSLQKDEAGADIRLLGAEGLVHDLTPQIQDFYDTAALLQQMDLVVSVDSALANLAGAMHVPTIVLLPYVTCWRWKMQPAFFESVRTLKQHKPGDWAPVMERLVKAVANARRSHGQAER